VPGCGAHWTALTDRVSFELWCIPTSHAFQVEGRVSLYDERGPQALTNIYVRQMPASTICVLQVPGINKLYIPKYRRQEGSAAAAAAASASCWRCYHVQQCRINQQALLLLLLCPAACPRRDTTKLDDRSSSKNTLYNTETTKLNNSANRAPGCCCAAALCTEHSLQSLTP
jgi:hypothetical protein